MMFNLLSWSLISVVCDAAFYKRLPIGVLLDDLAVPRVQTFVRHALRVHNNMSTTSLPLPHYFKLDKHEKVVDSTDSYRLTQAMCQMMSKRTLATLGVVEESTLGTLDSFTRTFHVPFVTTTTVPTLNVSTRLDGGYILFLRPSYDEALLSIVRHYNWTNILYLYDSDSGLIRVQLLQQWSLHADVEPIRLMDVADNHDVLRAIDRRVSPTEKHVVLDLSNSQALSMILAQVGRVHCQLTPPDIRRMQVHATRPSSRITGGVN